jgi:hypothetical protein
MYKTKGLKFLLLTMVTLLTTVTVIGQVQFCFFAGPQATAARYTILNVKQHNDLKYGFQAGIGVKVPFDNNLVFSPAIFYSMKGYKVTFSRFAYPPDSTAKDNNTTIHCVELAFLLEYDFTKTPNHFFVKGGPSLDFLLFGKESFNLMSGGSVNRNMPFGFADYGHYSANMLGQLGYETGSGFFIFIQYTHGMANISNVDGGPRICNRAYGISIGKYLGRKKIVIDTRNKE